MVAQFADLLDRVLTGKLVSTVDRSWMGEAIRFEFEPTADWSGYKIELLLRRYGIRIGGRERAWIDENDQFRSAFSVKIRQAEFAEYLLLAYRVPVTSPLRFPANAKYAENAPTRGGWGRRPDLMGWIMDFVGRILGIDYANFS